MKEHVCYAADGSGGGPFNSLVPDYLKDTPSLIPPETRSGLDDDTAAPLPAAQPTETPPPFSQHAFHYETDAHGHRALVVDGNA